MVGRCSPSVASGVPCFDWSRGDGPRRRRLLSLTPQTEADHTELVKAVRRGVLHIAKNGPEQDASAFSSLKQQRPFVRPRRNACLMGRTRPPIAFAVSASRQHPVDVRGLPSLSGWHPASEDLHPRGSPPRPSGAGRANLAGFGTVQNRTGCRRLWQECPRRGRPAAQRRERGYFGGKPDGMHHQRGPHPMALPPGVDTEPGHQDRRQRRVPRAALPDGPASPHLEGAEAVAADHPVVDGGDRNARAAALPTLSYGEN